MLGLNTEQWFGLARQVLPIIGTMLTTLGFMKPATLQLWTDTIMQISGPVIIVISAVWGAITKTQANILSTAKSLTDINGKNLVNHIELALTVAGRELEKATPDGISVGSYVGSSPLMNAAGPVGGTTFKP